VRRAETFVERRQDEKRLRQQNPPATPDNSAAFGEKSLETVCLEFLILKQALKQTPGVCLRAF
jgi:hypothetical protein